MDEAKVNDVVAIPSEVPDGKLPAEHPKQNNLAGDEELVKEVMKWWRKHYDRFDGQDARNKFTEDGGTMDLADRAYRVSLERDENDPNYDSTASSCPSTIYQVAVRAVNSALCNIFFADEDIPARYEPEVNTMEYDQTQGEQIARQENGLAMHTWDNDDRKDKCRESILWTLKYGLYIVSDEWDARKDTVIDRVPTAFDDQGNPVAFSEKEVVREIAWHPTLILHDPKDCWFDAQIKDVNKQRCFIVRKQYPLEHFMQLQMAGLVTNIDKLTTRQLYNGENTSNDVLQRRQINAGEDTIAEPTGLFDCYHVWGRIPVQESKRKGRGKWAPGKAKEQLYWGMFVGRADGEMVCVKLVKSPYNHGRIPYQILHSHRDDKGAYSLGFPTMLMPLYWQDYTLSSSWFDNIRMLLRAGYITDGKVHTRDLTFRTYKLIETERGSRFERLEVPDVTNAVLPMKKQVQDEIKQTIGATDAVMGEITFSRTSATESKQTLDQSLLPIDDMAGYLGDQLFRWMFELDSSMWRQYGKPGIIKMVSKSNQIVEMKPTELWGPIKTKVTAVSRFRNTLQRRMEMNRFMQNALPFFKDVMGIPGMKAFAKQMFAMSKLENLDELLPMDPDGDARTQAANENYVLFMTGKGVVAMPNENHPVHIKIHESAIEEAAASGVTPEKIAPIEAHVREHQGLYEEQVAGRPRAAAQPGAEPGLPGEVMGDALAAEEGAMAT